MNDRATRNEPALSSGTSDTLDALFAFADRSDAPGFTVAIARAGRVLYRKGFGMASLEHGTRNVPTTRMRIGSTTKHFACLCALLLAEEGKLDIDAGVRTYLPEVPAPEGQPTLRQLMTHTGGQHCHLDLGFLSDGMAVKPEGSCMEQVLRQHSANFAPGDAMMYNNAGYHLLSRAIERVSGQPLRTFMRERLFAPLGLADTDLVPSDFEIVNGMATLHVPMPDGSQRRGIFVTEEILGEGGIVSTVDDMLKWVAHLRRPHVVGSERSWREMLRPTTLNNGFTSSYSLGLMRFTYRGVETICHAGGVVGGGCQMLTIPDRELDIVVLSNTQAVEPAQLAFKIVDALLKDESVLLDEVAGVPTNDFACLAGRSFHSRESGLFLRFEDKGGVIGAAAYNSPVFALVDRGGTLELEFHNLAVGPITIDKPRDGGADTVPATLHVLTAGTPTTLEPVEPITDAAAITDAADAVIGDYASDELAATIVVARQGDELRLKIQGQYGRTEQVLEPLTRGLFTFRAARFDIPVTGVVETEWVAGEVRALLLSTTRTIRLRLARVAAPGA
jgi:D-aminopeptidase